MTAGFPAIAAAARYRIRHRSHYRYEQPVRASFNEARLAPKSTRSQHPLESTISVEPASWQHRYVDYWGTRVTFFEAHEPHTDLTVDASSVVEVEPGRRPDQPDSLRWDELRASAAQYAEYLVQRDATEPPEDLAALAVELTEPDPQSTARAISAAIHDRITYLPGSTGVHTVASEAWASGSGVCQDYAHLLVGALRHVGIPARYVSGYLHPSSEPTIGEPVTGESHAWVQWWLGDWTGHDPTNQADVADRHVVIGWGRDYSDVPPIKGIVAGEPASTELAVQVEIARLV